MVKGTKINLEQLRREVRALKRWHPLYKLLKQELTAMGYWKIHQRGNPQKGFIKGLGKRSDSE